MSTCLQEQQSAKGADPQPEFYIDKITHLTEVGTESPWYVVWWHVLQHSCVTSARCCME